MAARSYTWQEIGWHSTWPASSRRLGFHVLEPVVYTTVAATRFSEAIATKLARSEIDGVLLLSPRTARVYVNLAAKEGLLTLAAACSTTACPRGWRETPIPRGQANRCA